MSAAKRKNLSRYDVLVIASMIEREALVPRDRRLISAVIYNRLKENIPLGIDATLRYALNQWSRPLRVSELNSNSSLQHAQAPRPAADADRQPAAWPRCGRREPRARPVPVLRRQAVRQRRPRLLLDGREVPAGRREVQPGRARSAAARTLALLIPTRRARCIESDALAHLVTIAADGSPQVSLVWVGLDGDDIVFASLGPRRKLDNIVRDPRVSLSIEGAGRTRWGCASTSSCTAAPGSSRAAGRSCSSLAHTYIGPDVKFPPMDDPPPGVVVHITADRVGGVGPWA